MRIDDRARKFVRLGRHRQLLLLEALGAVTGSSLAIALIPFRHAVQVGSRRLPRNHNRSTENEALAVSKAIEAIGRVVPWRVVCFQEGLALQWMLRRRGFDARLHYGIGYGERRALGAHVWVSVGDKVLLGGADRAQFRPVAVYPEATAFKR